MTVLLPLIEADFDFEFGPYRLQPAERVNPVDEVCCIERGPHCIAQGILVNRLPNGRAVIRCGGKYLSGKLIRRSVRTVKGVGQ